MSPITIRVHGLADHLCCLEGDLSWSAADVRAAVETATGITRWEQQLVFHHTELLGNTTLQDLTGAQATQVASGGAVDLTLIRRPPQQSRLFRELEEMPGDALHSLVANFSAEEKADREVVLAAVRRRGRLLGLAAPELRDDRELVLTAVQQDGLALGCASAPLRADRELVLEAVRKQGLALMCASLELKADREVVLAAVRGCGMSLQCASEQLRADRGVVLEAVRRFGQSLRWASPELQGDREIVLEALGETSLAMLYVAEALKADRKVALAAIRNGAFLDAVHRSLQADVEILTAALRRNAETAAFFIDKLNIDAIAVRAARRRRLLTDFRAAGRAIKRRRYACAEANWR